jgi:hypothetical protein
MLGRAISLGLLLALCSTSRGAVIYEPVQYQYHCGSQVYYYGGRHPEAVADVQRRAYALRHSDPNYQPPTFTFHTDVTPAVYSDVAPYMNLSVYGYTATDAQNEANSSMPRYFRKADLLAAGKMCADGNFVVPANAIPIPHAHVDMPTTRPATQAIIIIPKTPAAPKVKPVEMKVADAH